MQIKQAKYTDYSPVTVVPAINFYLFRVLHRFQHFTGHITKGTLVDRGNKYIQSVKVLYCKLPTISKQLPGFEPLTSEVRGNFVTTAP